MEPLCEYLNGDEARNWLEANCQRAAGGFLRIQSAVLRDLPVPERVVKNGLGRKVGRQEKLVVTS
jgi:hypothetical protein